MKARRIATQRIGGGDTPVQTQHDGCLGTVDDIVTAALVVLVAVLVLGLLYTRFTMPTVNEVLQTTVVATLTPTQTLKPTATHTPTLIPITPTPLPTITLEHGITLAQVWLYDAPGGNKMPAGLLAGQSVIVLEYRDDFVKVLWDGGDTAIVGWVAERWISVE